MIKALVRPANPEDHQKLSSLIFYETHLHRHLDWRSPLEWLGDPYFWALDEGRQLSAALACPIEMDGIAWVRLFVFAGGWSAENAWQVLWQTARADIAQAGGARVAVIAMQTWFQRILADSGFKSPQQIVMLEWHGFTSQPSSGSEAEGIRIRKMTEADLPDVQNVDAASFDPLWQNSLETLQRAYSQSLLATVAETQAEILGYQISTGSGGQRAHLARLAVHPNWQGRRLGRALLTDLCSKLVNNGIYKLSVNTQSDNVVSLGLYQRMGFLRTGEQYPVYTFDVPAEL